jgi:flagellar biosynthesis protein FliP
VRARWILVSFVAAAGVVLSAPAAMAADASPLRPAATASVVATQPRSLQIAATGVTPPAQPTAPAAPSARSTGSVSINVPTKPSQTLTIILLLTVLSVAPSILILTTSFTKMAVVLSLTRNALGLQSIPPNQVIAGLALFLSIFVMTPTFKAMYADGVKPWMNGEETAQVALAHAEAPLKTFMLKQTSTSEIDLMLSATNQQMPTSPSDIPLTTLIPAFVLSELRSAFIIGFVIFIPFLIIDLVVSSTLMSLGMMMMPPTLVSLPFKLLLFVMVDGWALVVQSLLKSYT